MVLVMHVVMLEPDLVVLYLVLEDSVKYHVDWQVSMGCLAECEVPEISIRLDPH